MSTRLILIELEEPSTAEGMAKAVSVWELPSAEELGRAAYREGNQLGPIENTFRAMGNAIIARIKTAAPAPSKS